MSTSVGEQCGMFEHGVSWLARIAVPTEEHIWLLTGVIKQFVEDNNLEDVVSAAGVVVGHIHASVHCWASHTCFAHGAGKSVSCADGVDERQTRHAERGALGNCDSVGD